MATAVSNDSSSSKADKLPSFQHQSLQSPSHIRLLKKQTPKPDGTLSFSLVQQDISSPDRQSYYCLSYTWGNPFAHGNGFSEHYKAVGPEYEQSHSVSILIDDKQMLISKNLCDALNLIPSNSYNEYVGYPLDTSSGQRNIHIAAAKGRATNIETWLYLGADINILDDNANSPLHYAANSGHIECVKTLIKYGCDINLKNGEGKTASDLAAEKGFDSIVTLLIDYHHDNTTIQKVSITVADCPQILVWADAICINQKDIAEKSTQVTMMDLIYSQAIYVVGWLGPHDHHSKLAISTIQTLTTHFKQFKDSEIEPFGGRDKEKYTDAGIPLISNEAWDAVASVYQRQWFRRAWIVQEAVLPNVFLMYLGDNYIQWRDLGSLAEAIRYLEAKLGTNSSSKYVPLQEVGVSVVWNMAEVSKWRRFKANAQEGMDKMDVHRGYFRLNELINNFWTFVSSDPRDKIFAYYGLVNLYTAQRSLSDYRLSTPNVFAMATRKLIEEQGNLHILSCCVYPLHRREGLPSWVPDYSLPGINAMPASFSADKGLELEYTAPPFVGDASDLTLKIRGAFIGMISLTADRTGTEAGEKTRFDRSWLTLPLSLRGKGGYGDKPYLSSILWETLCMNFTAGSLFDQSVYGDKVPLEQGVEFRHFLMLLILASADGLIRDKLGLEKTTSSSLDFSHLDYDPMAEDMEPVLADLDAFAVHDGPESCWLPSREEVLKYWNNYVFNLVRNVPMDSDGGPFDFHLPAGVTQKNSRPFGNGLVVLSCKTMRRCQKFLSPYLSMYGGRHLVTVNERYLGIASIASKPGDEVWILPGLQAPAILRPISTSTSTSTSTSPEPDTNKYEFLGASYIHGMMDGSICEGIKGSVRDIELV